MQSEGWGSLSGDTCVPLGGAGGFLGLTSSVPSFTHSGTPAPPPTGAGEGTEDWLLPPSLAGKPLPVLPTLGPTGLSS